VRRAGKIAANWVINHHRRILRNGGRIPSLDELADTLATENTTEIKAFLHRCLN
jgi:hypothetical protein